MVAIATGQKDILKIMLDPDLNILEVTRKNSPFINIVKWAIENDHIALLQVCCHKILQSIKLYCNNYEFSYGSWCSI